MATKPWFDVKRKAWILKYKPSPTGPQKKVTLGKQPQPWSPTRPPKNPPQYIKDRAREFEEIEYRAKHQMAAAPKRARTLAGYVEDYVDAYEATHTASSIRQLKRHAKVFLAFAKDRKVDTVQGVNKAFCRDYLEQRIKAVSPASLQVERGFLSGIWTRAIDDELIESNPWRYAKVPGKVIEHEATFWNEEEILAIASACLMPVYGDMVWVLAGTGIRVSAVLNMRWDWIDFAEGMVQVKREHSKSGRPYKIVMTETAREVLERRAAESKGSDLVFPSRKGGGVIPYNTASRAIMRAIERAGVKYGTTHDLRHSYGRWMAMKGIPFPVIQAQLGHSSPKMTARYTKVNEQEAKKHIEGMSIEPPASS